MILHTLSILYSSFMTTYKCVNVLDVLKLTMSSFNSSSSSLKPDFRNIFGI